MCVLIKSGAATEPEQDEAPDVLTVGVAAGDAGTRYDSSFSCFYQRNKKKRKKLHWCSRESRSNTLIQKYSNAVHVCVCACVHVCYVSSPLKPPQGARVCGSFLFDCDVAVEQRWRRRLWWPDCVAILCGHDNTPCASAQQTHYALSLVRTSPSWRRRGYSSEPPP